MEGEPVPRQRFRPAPRHRPRSAAGLPRKEDQLRGLHDGPRRSIRAIRRSPHRDALRHAPRVHALSADRVRTDEERRATEFIDRAGNKLWRRYAQNVFLIALHKADGCAGAPEPFSKLCAPLAGLIDCAAERNGGRAVGFDILGSPLAEAKFPQESFYAIAHPMLRMIDYADGYVWQEDVDHMTLVDLIPLAEYAPEEKPDSERLAEWSRRAEDLKNPGKRTSWTTLGDWRGACGMAK